MNHECPEYGEAFRAACDMLVNDIFGNARRYRDEACNTIAMHNFAVHQYREERDAARKLAE